MNLRDAVVAGLSLLLFSASSAGAVDPFPGLQTAEDLKGSVNSFNNSNSRRLNAIRNTQTTNTRVDNPSTTNPTVIRSNPNSINNLLAPYMNDSQPSTTRQNSGPMSPPYPVNPPTLTPLRYPMPQPFVNLFNTQQRMYSLATSIFGNQLVMTSIRQVQASDAQQASSIASQVRADVARNQASVSQIQQSIVTQIYQVANQATINQAIAADRANNAILNYIAR